MGVEIQEHLKDLERYASECEIVAEFGVQHGEPTGSSTALLRGVKRELISVEIAPPHEYIYLKSLAKELDKTWTLYVADSKSVTLPEVDFLFIDSEHTRMQVLAELHLHAEWVKKYLGFHDTAPCKYGSFPDYTIAILGWMEEHQDEWELDLHKTNCCGLTIYRRIG